MSVLLPIWYFSRFIRDNYLNPAILLATRIRVIAGFGVLLT
jgi:hypothetical protein